MRVRGFNSSNSSILQRLAAPESELGLDIIELIPPAADSCVMAVRAGMPVVEAFEGTPIATSLNELATKLVSDPLLIRKIA